MAAIHESFVFYEGDGDDINRAIEDGVKILTQKYPRFRVEMTRPGFLMLRVGVNWRSWGERITVESAPKSIRIVSECSFPLQIIDWGKNFQNVELVRTEILAITSPLTEDPNKASLGNPLPSTNRNDPIYYDP